MSRFSFAQVQRRRWHRQIGSNYAHRHIRGPRSCAALSYLTMGPVRSGLVDLRHLTLAVLFDETSDHGSLHTRFVGARADLQPLGVQFGGLGAMRFEKDLCSRPDPHGHGRRFALRDARLLARALVLDEYLERHARHRFFPRPTAPRLPRLWAAFELGNATHFSWQRVSTEDGHPRLSVESRWLSEYQLVLFPLDQVTRHVSTSVGIYADLATFPKRQAFNVSERTGLCGQDGLVGFDFRYGRRGRCHARPRRDSVQANQSSPLTAGQYV